MQNEKKDILWRIYLVYFFTVAFAMAILVRVVYIQMFEGEYWKEQAKASTMRYVNIDAVRGDICADDGRLLATSVPVYEIRMDLSRAVVSDEVFFAGVDSLSYNLSRLFRDRSQAQYKANLMKGRREQDRYFLIKRGVGYNQLIALRGFPIFRLGRYRGGVIVVERNRRETPFKSLAARTIGYEREGVYVGLEGAYREYLEGIQGKRLVQRISGGAWMPVNDENEIKPKNGKDIITTLNINIQDIAESALRRQLSRYDAQHGTVVIMEVATGKIKAISNLTRNAAGFYEETFNYAIGESTEPGSTFKLATMMAALEDGFVDPNAFIQTGDGKINYADRVMRDAKEGGFGTITIKNAFEVSSNVAISKIIHEAYHKNPQRFIDRLKAMNVGVSLDVEISGEGKPFLPEVNSPSWSGVTLPWMAIGYNVSMTPLQTLTLYNAVANNGRMMKPMFVEEIRQTGNTIKRFQPQVVNRSVASEKTLRIIREMLEGVVENGTAQNIKTATYKIAGKTGTAQVAQSRHGYRGERGVAYRASFAGYFPADKPVYSGIVVIQNPKGWVYSGNQVAAPVFREVADKIYATHINMPGNYLQQPDLAHFPAFRAASAGDLKAIYSALGLKFPRKHNGQWVSAQVVNDTLQVSSREMVENLVPNVVGMGLKDALFILENAGLQVRFAGRGVVRTQSIRAGTRIGSGNVIFLELS